jgi:hypothetical protein
MNDSASSRRTHPLSASSRRTHPLSKYIIVRNHFQQPIISPHNRSHRSAILVREHLSQTHKHESCIIWALPIFVKELHSFPFLASAHTCIHTAKYTLTHTNIFTRLSQSHAVMNPYTQSLAVLHTLLSTSHAPMMISPWPITNHKIPQELLRRQSQDRV